MGKKKLVQGHGVNDVGYAVSRAEYVDGFTKSGNRKRVAVWHCPYYKKWERMLVRVYSESSHKKRPTYKNASVCGEWLRLSNFIKWVDSQPERGWEDMSMDKDFLIEGNKHYAPDTTVFIKSTVNNFIIDSGATRGEYMLGVSLHKHDSIKPFRAWCSDPLKRSKSGHIGYYTTELEAHLAWKATKHKYALELAETQSDSRVAEVLRNKYK